MSAIPEGFEFVSTPVTVEDNSQEWAGMGGAVAWHLIDRHAENWLDTEKMMMEWLAANQAPQPPVSHAKPENQAEPNNGGACVSPVIREAIEAAFERREGWMAKIAAAVRALPDAVTQPTKREPLNKDQRHAICVKAEEAMKQNPNLSWRDALISQTEAAHGIGGEA